MAAMRWIEDNVYDDTFPLWTRANVGEVLPEPPSPLGWDLVFEGGTALGWRDCMVNRLGVDESEIDPVRPEVLGLFGGYAYLGATMLRVWAQRTPGFSAQMLDDAYFAGHPDVPPYVPEPWHENQRTTETMTTWLGWVMVDRNQDELEADRVATLALRADRPDLRAASDAELMERARSIKPMCRHLFDQHINQSGAASIAPGVIGAVCAAIGEPTKAMRLLAGIGGVDSAAPSFAMWDLSRIVRDSVEMTALFDKGPIGLTARMRASVSPVVRRFLGQLDELLVEFGSRGPNEWDLHSATWELEPDLVIAAIDRMRLADDDAAPGAHHAVLESERHAIGQAITEALAGDPVTQGQFVAALASAATFLPGRERSKTNVIRALGEIRLCMWEIGRRAVERGELKADRDICLLFLDEVEDLLAGTLDDPASLVAQRQAHLDWLASLEPPFIIASAPAPNVQWPQRGARRAPVACVGDTLIGLPGCPGISTGRARIVLHPADPTALSPGEILVAPMTDPAWTPLFVSAGGVVVDVGAPLSHAIIVSRELGIPCVVSVTGATERIPDGALIEVNGDTGTVTVLSLH